MRTKRKRRQRKGWKCTEETREAEGDAKADTKTETDKDKERNT